MKKLMLFLVLFICVLGYSQKAVTDSTTIFGFVKNVVGGTYIGKPDANYCMLSLDKKVETGTMLIVTGIKHCDAVLLKQDADFFEVGYKGEIYYTSKGDLEFADSFDYFNAIKNLSEEEYNEFNESSTRIAKLYNAGKVSKILAKIDACKPKGLSILYWDIFDVSEYTEGTGAKFAVYNPTKKTIKYILFTLVGKNPVGDVVYKKKQASVKVRAVGPLKPDASASYSFDYVWFTDLVETARITSILVTYMDGTTKLIEKPKSIELSKSDYDYLKDI